MDQSGLVSLVVLLQSQKTSFHRGDGEGGGQRVSLFDRSRFRLQDDAQCSAAQLNDDCFYYYEYLVDPKEFFLFLLTTNMNCLFFLSI